MPIAVVVFDFDPLLQLLDGIVVRWQTIALAIVIAATLLWTGLSARLHDLRPDDMLFIVIGIVPGAVVGGRLGYALLHADYFAPRVAAIVDPATGGLELGLAVVGGLLTGVTVTSLLGAPVGAWLHHAALPVLAVLGAGKLTMAIGGAGQGQASASAWATAYLGPGPWGSLAPALPSIPSQIIEGVLTLAIAVVLALAISGGAFASRDGRAMFVAIGAWALARAAVSLTWRDPAVVGSLNAGTLMALAIAVGCLVTILVMSLRRRSDVASTTAALSTAPAPAWPDPDDRPRF